MTGKTPPLRIPYALSVYDDHEIQAVVRVLSEHRTNMGRETELFEKKVAKLFGKKYGIMVNSGSSANLLAVELLKIPKGSEVITPLLTFSTTIAPIIQRGLIPVFTDVTAGKYTIDVDQVESLISKKTKAIMVPLLLGNVPEMDRLANIAKKHNLFLIEDSCDTIGATYKGKPTGSFSDITVTSFFGSHVITAGGNGGMILVNDAKWKDRAKLLRGWGRSSSVFRESEMVKKRFQHKIDNIEYDAKFLFEEVAYNFLPSELGAAFGIEQLKKLPLFKRIRKENFSSLKTFFSKYENFLILPQMSENVSTAWLAFPLLIKKGAPFSRMDLVKYLEKENIQTRPIFTGNILKHPGFKKIDHRENKGGYPVTNEVMERGFIIGCHHGLSRKHIERLKNVFTLFFSKYI